MLRSVGQVLCGDASHQRVGWKIQRHRQNIEISECSSLSAVLRVLQSGVPIVSGPDYGDVGAGKVRKESDIKTEGTGAAFILLRLGDLQVDLITPSQTQLHQKPVNHIKKATTTQLGRVLLRRGGEIPMKWNRSPCFHIGFLHVRQHKMFILLTQL